MTLKYHLLAKQDGRTGETACGIAVQKNPQIHAPESWGWDTVSGKISRGCIVKPARQFEPYPDKACIKCCTAYGEGAGI